MPQMYQHSTGPRTTEEGGRTTNEGQSPRRRYRLAWDWVHKGAARTPGVMYQGIFSDRLLTAREERGKILFKSYWRDHDHRKTRPSN